ncbi:hypothetical protein LEP1GSC052_1863 [Leptospira kmetyi serovar Malaysia str. Bejo-Iso9]|nr:hypothetical protein LEP1GSC052_1863 [Leptospira kmetyi serovar Malaysia str. Bejo-Iso9]
MEEKVQGDVVRSNGGWILCDTALKQLNLCRSREILAFIKN